MSWDDSTTEGLSGLGGALLLIVCGAFWSLAWIIGGLVPFGLLAARRPPKRGRA